VDVPTQSAKQGGSGTAPVLRGTGMLYTTMVHGLARVRGVGAFSADDYARTVAAFEAAPFRPGAWTEALELVAAAGGGWATHFLGLTDADGLVFDTVTRITPDLIAEWERRGGSVTDINPRVATLWTDPFTILADDDVSTAAMRARSAFYQDVYRPVEADYALMGRLGSHGPLRAAVAVIRTARQGHADCADRDRLAALLPHADAALRLQLLLNGRDIAATIGAFEAIALPAFLCNAWGRVTAMTAAGEAALGAGDIFALKGGRLVAVDRRRDPAFQDLLHRAVRRPGDLPRPGRSGTLVLGSAAGAVRRVDVAPLPPATLHLTAGDACLVTIAAPKRVEDPAALLQQAFRLTPAEAAIALDLAAGLPVATIAERRRVSVATVKGQSRSVLAKTGCAKTSGLAAVIGRLNL